jgi:hypothetical protein
VLGHANIDITKDVYGHLPEGDKRAAAESMSRALFSAGIALGGVDADVTSVVLRLRDRHQLILIPVNRYGQRLVAVGSGCFGWGPGGHPTSGDLSLVSCPPAT